MSHQRPIPEALLERYLAGDLSGEMRAQLESVLAQSSSERARLHELRAESEAYLLRHPPRPLVDKWNLGRPARARWFAWLTPIAALAGIAVVVLVRPEEAELRPKGQVGLTVFRQADGGLAERVSQGAALKSGDRLRFSVQTPADGYVAVLSRDGAGHVTVYYPYQGQKAAPHKAAEALLPGAVSLDDVRGPEQIWALYSAKPFELAPLLSQLEQGLPPASAKVERTRFDWVKE